MDTNVELFQQTMNFLLKKKTSGDAATIPNKSAIKMRKF